MPLLRPPKPEPRISVPPAKEMLEGTSASLTAREEKLLLRRLNIGQMKAGKPLYASLQDVKNVPIKILEQIRRPQLMNPAFPAGTIEADDRLQFFPTMSLREVFEAQERVEYLIEDCLVKGQPAITAGPSKALKTTIELDRALSLATGEPFLGRFKVQSKCKVLIASRESGLATIRDTIKGLAACKRIRAKQLHELMDSQMMLFSFHVPKISNDEMLAEFHYTVFSFDAQVVIVDPLYLALDDTQNSLVLTGQALDRMCGPLTERGITTIFVDHLKRGVTGVNNYRPPELTDLSGAGKAEFFRQWTLIGRRAAFDSSESFESGIGKHKLWMSLGGSAGHTSTWAIDITEYRMMEVEEPKRDYEIVVRTAAEERIAKQADKASLKTLKSAEGIEAKRSKVKAILDSSPDGKGVTEIRTLSKLSHRDCKDVLDALVEDGEVQTSDSVRYGKTVRLYSAVKPVMTLRASKNAR